MDVLRGPCGIDHSVHEECCDFHRVYIVMRLGVGRTPFVQEMW